MKKIYRFVAVLFVCLALSLFAFAGCSDDSDKEERPNTPPGEQTPTGHEARSEERRVGKECL